MRISDWSSDVCSSDLLLAQAPRLELDCLLCWPIKRIGIVLQALPGPSEVCCLLLEHRSRVLTDRGIEFETSTFQQAFEPSVCVCSSSGQSNPFAEGVHGGQRFEGAKVGPAAEEIDRLGPRELAVYQIGKASGRERRGQ